MLTISPISTLSETRCRMGAYAYRACRLCTSRSAMLHAQIGLAHAVARAHLLWPPFEQFLALVHHDDVVGNTHDKIDVMFDQHNRDAARERFNQRVELG